MRMLQRPKADFCFVHGQKGCTKSSCFTKVLVGELRIETCVHPSTRIPGHVSSLDVRKAVFSSLGAGEHGFYSKINTTHLSGAVRQPGVCVPKSEPFKRHSGLCVYFHSLIEVKHSL